MRCTSLSFIFFAPLAYTPAVPFFAASLHVSTTFGSSFTSKGTTGVSVAQPYASLGLKRLCISTRFTYLTVSLRCNSTPWFAIKSSISKTVRRQPYASLNLIHLMHPYASLVPMHRRTGDWRMCTFTPEVYKVQPKWCGGCAPQVQRSARGAQSSQS